MVVYVDAVTVGIISDFDGADLSVELGGGILAGTVEERLEDVEEYASFGDEVGGSER